MDFEAAVAKERRRDFAQRYVVHRAIGASIRSAIDLSTVTTESTIQALGIGPGFIERLAADFGWEGDVPRVDSPGDLVEFFAVHYAPDSPVGLRMHLFGRTETDRSWGA